MSRFAGKADDRAVVDGHRVHDDNVFTRLCARYGDDGTYLVLVAGIQDSQATPVG